MFTIPRPNVIACDEGFTVEILGPTGLRYSEGGKTVDIDCELLAGPSGLVLYEESIRAWGSSPVEEAIDIAARQAIVENIRRAFRSRGFAIQVV